MRSTSKWLVLSFALTAALASGCGTPDDGTNQDPAYGKADNSQPGGGDDTLPNKCYVTDDDKATNQMFNERSQKKMAKITAYYFSTNRPKNRNEYVANERCWQCAINGNGTAYDWKSASLDKCGKWTPPCANKNTGSASCYTNSNNEQIPYWYAAGLGYNGAFQCVATADYPYYRGFDAAIAADPKCYRCTSFGWSLDTSDYALNQCGYTQCSNRCFINKDQRAITWRPYAGSCGQNNSTNRYRGYGSNPCEYSCDGFGNWAPLDGCTVTGAPTCTNGCYLTRDTKTDFWIATAQAPNGGKCAATDPDLNTRDDRANPADNTNPAPVLSSQCDKLDCFDPMAGNPCQYYCGTSGWTVADNCQYKPSAPVVCPANTCFVTREEGDKDKAWRAESEPKNAPQGGKCVAIGSINWDRNIKPTPSTPSYRYQCTASGWSRL